MKQLLVDRRDIDFVLWEQLNSEKLIDNGRYEGFNRKACDMMITEAGKLATNEVLPSNEEGDRQGISFDKGVVKVPECFHRPFEILKEGRWLLAGLPREMGGYGAPALITAAIDEHFIAANPSLVEYLKITGDIAKMIHFYGTPEQKVRYVKKLVTGQWCGAMLITEPNAGSDVGAIETSAVKNADGTYSLTGNKIFITGGEHDLAENIIHHVIARVEGGPPGTKGISIFIVPKYLINTDGSLGKRNDIVCSGVENKMGLHGQSTCSMTLGANDNCIGYLLGQENQGLKIMFHALGDSRIYVGLLALGQASAAYLLAIKYARERIQGRDIANFADRSAPSVPIISHPDVRRNLITMKSYLDGMTSFYYYVTTIGMKAAHAKNEEEHRFNEDLLNFYTPLVKDCIARKGYDVCIQSIQVYGGAGYTQSYPVEQYARDSKPTTIYDGTSGIQAMDFLARRLNAREGKIFDAFVKSILETTERAKTIEGLADLGARVANAAQHLAEVAAFMGKSIVSPRSKIAFAFCLPFLNVASETILAWMLLWRAVVAKQSLKQNPKTKDKVFYEGQIKTAEFYIRTLLPSTMGLMDGILDGSDAAMAIEEAAFGGK